MSIFSPLLDRLGLSKSAKESKFSAVLLAGAADPDAVTRLRNQIALLIIGPLEALGMPFTKEISDETSDYVKHILLKMQKVSDPMYTAALARFVREGLMSNSEAVSAPVSRARRAREDSFVPVRPQRFDRPQRPARPSTHLDANLVSTWEAQAEQLQESAEEWESENSNIAKMYWQAWEKTWDAIEYSETDQAYALECAEEARKLVEQTNRLAEQPAPVRPQSKSRPERPQSDQPKTPVRPLRRSKK